jgi:hypothetical protein
MHEIVIVRTAYYPKGCEVHADALIAHSKEQKYLWWFDGPFTTKDLGLALKPNPPELTSKVACEAIWFKFEFVPNLRELEHYQPGSSYMKEEFEGTGFDLFENDMPALVEIVRRKVKESEYPEYFTDTDFYALYDVEVYPQHDGNGEYCGIEIEPILLGELDMSKIERALVVQEAAK